MYSVSFDELHIPLHHDHYAFLEYLRANMHGEISGEISSLQRREASEEKV
jgi:hypothetical protein